MQWKWPYITHLKLFEAGNFKEILKSKETTLVQRNWANKSCLSPGQFRGFERKHVALINFHFNRKFLFPSKVVTNNTLACFFQDTVIFVLKTALPPLC